MFYSPIQSWPRTAVITQQRQPHIEAISAWKGACANGDVLAKTLITGRAPKLIFDPEVSPISTGGAGVGVWGGESGVGGVVAGRGLNAGAPFRTQLSCTEQGRMRC